MTTKAELPRGECSECARTFALNGDGRVRWHRDGGVECAGSGGVPVDLAMALAVEVVKRGVCRIFDVQMTGPIDRPLTPARARLLAQKLLNAARRAEAMEAAESDA